MEKLMEKFIATFENLIRRGIAPSVALFVIYGLLDLVRAEWCQCGLDGEERLEQWRAAAGELSDPDGVVALGVFLLVLGLSYVLTTINQVVFDERLRKNFLGSWGWRGNNQRLETLRAQVLDRLRRHPDLHRLADPAVGLRLRMTDYLLYEILGGIDPEPTRSFVDSAKALGVVAVALIASLVTHGLLADSPVCQWVLLLLVAPTIWLGREAVKAQYRSRSIRHYVNFLMMPDSTVDTLLRKHEVPKQVEKAAE